MPSASDQSLAVFDLQRFCTADGPGIRTVVFVKGCPLRCLWCQNPESLSAEPELAWYAERCQGCLRCTEVCPERAVTFAPQRLVDASRCEVCGRCAEVCPHEAVRKVGRRVTIPQLLQQIEADRAYYDCSGGGVTLSGGEPLQQAAAAAELLARCRQRGIHTVVETSGAGRWGALQRLLPHVNLFYFDLKAHADPLHRRLTGAGALPIQQRARQLVETGARVQFRMPVIPGHNDHPEVIDGIAELVEQLGQRAIRLLRYHRGGDDKLTRLSTERRPLGRVDGDADAALDRVAARFETRGLEVVREGDHRRDGQRPGVSDDPAFSERVWRLRQAVQRAEPTVCAERALLVTQYFKRRRNRRKPLVVQKAEALHHLLRHKRATIHDDELLVGNFTGKRVGGSIFPELHGVAVLEDLFAFDRREVNPLQIDNTTRLTLALRVMPHWITRFLTLRAFSPPRALRFIFEQLTGKAYLINETGGISHFVPDYRALLELGTSGIAARAEARRQTDGDRAFYRAVIIACQGLEALAASYARRARELAAAEADPRRRAELQGIAQTCDRVPRQPARTLQEALQAIVLGQIALNLESLDNAVSPGRLDQLLQPYYEADLAAGRIDRQRALDLVGCFTVKLSEIVPVFSRRITRFHGGLFNGQVVVVGGTDAEGHDATNPMTWLFLEAMDRLRMRQPNFHARIHPNSPPAYLERIAAMLERGSGAPSLVNDETIVPMLVGRGATLVDARDYSPVGCVEPVAGSATFGSTDAALVNLALCLERALGLKADGAPAASAAACAEIGQLVQLFATQVEHLVEAMRAELQAIERANARWHPTPLTSALIQGCLESATDASAGGARYNGSGIQGVGVADVADSLAAIERVVFEQRLCDMATLIAALRRDFAGQPHLRGHLLRAPKYGNDDPRADRFARQVMGIFSDALARRKNTRGGDYWAGFYSVTAHQAFGETTGALPSGRCAGQPLASGLSPANGFDRQGPTACLNSAAGLDLVHRATNGVNVNLKLDRTALAGEGGTALLGGLIRGYFARGGMQLQVNVLDPALLEDARDNPERYPWLLVRVSGYSAYFNDLSPEMKQEIIERAAHR